MLRVAAATETPPTPSLPPRASSFATPRLLDFHLYWHFSHRAIIAWAIAYMMPHYIITCHWYYLLLLIIFIFADIILFRCWLRHYIDAITLMLTLLLLYYIVTLMHCLFSAMILSHLQDATQLIYWAYAYLLIFCWLLSHYARHWYFGHCWYFRHAMFVLLPLMPLMPPLLLITPFLHAAMHFITPLRHDIADAHALICPCRAMPSRLMPLMRRHCRHISLPALTLFYWCCRLAMPLRYLLMTLPYATMALRHAPRRHCCICYIIYATFIELIFTLRCYSLLR